MILGAYSTRAGGGAKPLPRIVQLSIRPLSARRFRVGIHEEGSGYSFTQDVAMAATVEARLLALVAELHSWSLGERLTKRAAVAAATELGRTLDRVFLGRKGGAVLAGLEPKVLLVDVDETMLGLPWELLQSARHDWSNDVRFGRIVATSVPPRRPRDPRSDDPVVKILLVVNPTDDLAATGAELAVISGLAGQRANCTVEVQVLEGKQATRAGLATAVMDADHDIIHFAGHALFDRGDPHHSMLKLADGPLTVSAIRSLAWTTPPYLVFNSSCESARAAQGRRLVAAGGRVNGLAAAFLSVGCHAYLGHFWPVNDNAAATFAGCFYDTLFESVDAGAAVHAARRSIRPRYDEHGDMAAYGAVFFGDAGGEDVERFNLAQAV